MLGRSASGPGGLSINTGGGGLFGSGASTQPPAGGGLFGQTTAQPQAAGSLFGATAAAAQPQQQTGGGLFGATNTAQTQQTGGLFGRPAATATQPTNTGGLFGATTSQPQAQQAGGSLFGGQQPQQTQATGGFFGGGAAAQSQPAQIGGMFGQQQQQQQQQQQPQQANTGGLFGGGATAQPQAQQAGGMFGASAANTGGMFGANRSTLGGTGLFGLGGTAPLQQQQQQQQQQPQVAGLTMGQSAVKQQVIPGVRIDLSNIRSTTRFNDLQEDLQKELAAIDDRIQSCIRDYEAVEAFLPEHGEQLSGIPTDVNFVTRKSEGAHRALESDVEAISQLRELINRDADNARLSFKAIDNLKLPVQYHQAGLWSKSGVNNNATADANAESNSDLISFFSKTADEMDEMMKKFERNLGEIEVHLHGVQGNMMEQLQRAAVQSGNTSQVGVNERAMELAGVLRDFEEGILKVAGVVGGVKEGITELQLKDFMGHGS